MVYEMEISGTNNVIWCINISSISRNRSSGSNNIASKFPHVHSDSVHCPERQYDDFNCT